MGSTTTNTGVQTGAGPGNSNDTTPGGAPSAQHQDGDQPTFSQAQLNAFLGARLREARTKWEEEQRTLAERAQREAADREAKELGEWKTVAEGHEARAKELEAALARKERELLASRIAAKHGLPETLASRLQGDDEASLEADASALAKLLVPPASSGAPANSASGRGERQLSKDELRGMSPSQIAALDPAIVRAALSR
jgi:hypothetical protein